MMKKRQTVVRRKKAGKGRQLGNELKRMATREGFDPARCFKPAFLKLPAGAQDKILIPIRINLGQIAMTARNIKTKKQVSKLSQEDEKTIQRIGEKFDKLTIQLAKITTIEYFELIKSPNIHLGRGLGSYWHDAAHILYELKRNVIFGI